MGFFNFGKKKEAEAAPAAPAAAAPAGEQAASGGLDLKVLGSGCAKCHTLYENTQKAVVDLGVNASVEYVTDLERIASYGGLMTPALIINETVVSMGKVLKPADVEKLIQKQQ